MDDDDPFLIRTQPPASVAPAPLAASPPPESDDPFLLPPVASSGSSSAPLTMGGLASQGMSGINEGLANVLGFPVDMTNKAIGLGMAGINKVAGTNLQPSDQPFLGSASIKAMMPAGVITPPSGNPTEQTARYLGQNVGGAVIPAIATGGVGPALTTLASGVTSSVGGLVGRRFGGDTGEAIGQLAGGLVPLGSVTAARATMPRGPDFSTIPSANQLRSEAGDLYRQGEATGKTLAPWQTAALSDQLRSVVNAKGGLMPDGAGGFSGPVASAYPAINDAIKMVDAYAGAPMNPTEMQAVRTSLQNAAQQEGKQGAIGTEMLNNFDQLRNPSVPDFVQADSLWSQQARAGAVQQAIDLANAKGNRFSGSGLENSIRTQFQHLQADIIKGNPHGFLPNEIEAINNVADGTSGANFWRDVGKASPHGIVTTTLAGGFPYLAASQAGLGPWVSGAAGVGTLAAGQVGRNIATRLTQNAAKEALATALTAGGPVPRIPFVSPNVSSLAKALVATQAVNQNARKPGLANALIEAQASPQ